MAATATRPPPQLIADQLLNQFFRLAYRRISSNPAQDGDILKPPEPGYDQVLESLAIVARHTLGTLLENLSSWRDSEKSKGTNDVLGLRRKLAVEKIYISICLHLVQQAPLNYVLPVGVATSLEDLCFDWILVPERHILHPEFYEFRFGLVDLISRLLGALSRLRLPTIAKRFFNELDNRLRGEPNLKQRQDIFQLCSGLSHLQLTLAENQSLMTATAFLKAANPLARFQGLKKKSELQHAVCQMLTSILTPCLEAEPVHDGASKAWFETVWSIRDQLEKWMFKQSKHLQAVYPLVTVLLCLCDSYSFHNLFRGFLENIYKLFKERTTRPLGLECLGTLLRFYLDRYGVHRPREEVWQHLQNSTAPLLQYLRKGSFSQEVQQDALVDICITVARTQPAFAMSHLILELLRLDTPLAETTVIALRALLAVVEGTGNASENELHDVFDTKSLPSPGTLWTSARTPTLMGGYRNRKEIANIRLDLLELIASFLPQLNNQLGVILAECHRSFAQANMTANRPLAEFVPREKLHGLATFKWALRCVPNLVPDQWRSYKLCQVIPSYTISLDQGIRNEALLVLYRVMQRQPKGRGHVLQGMASFVVQPRLDEFPHIIHATVFHMVGFLRLWYACLQNRTGGATGSDTRTTIQPVTPSAASTADGVESDRQVVKIAADEVGELDTTKLEAVGLVFLCSPDWRIRRAALELLQWIRVLQIALSSDGAKVQVSDVPQTFVIDVLEESGADILQRCYWESSRWSDVGREWRAIPDGVTLTKVCCSGEPSDNLRWVHCLGELVKYVAELCPAPVQLARSEAGLRLMTLMYLDGGATANESRFEQWRNYGMFAASSPQNDAPVGTKDSFGSVGPSSEVDSSGSYGRSSNGSIGTASSDLGTAAANGSIRSTGSFNAKEGLGSAKINIFDLLRRAIIPSLKSVSEAQQAAAAMVLGRAHPDLYEALLAELVSLGDEAAEPKVKKGLGISNAFSNSAANKTRTSDFRVQVGHVYRMMAQTAWPGILSRSATLRYRFITFITESMKYLSAAPADMLWELQPLRYCLCVVTRCVAPILVQYPGEGWNTDLRRRLFYTVGAWCDEGAVQGWGADSRKEAERLRNAMVVRVKDPNERSTMELDTNGQIECLEWAAREAMSALLLGAAVDDEARRLRGRIVTWINNLFMRSMDHPVNSPWSNVSGSGMGTPNAAGSFSGAASPAAYVGAHSGLISEAVVVNDAAMLGVSQSFSRHDGAGSGTMRPSIFVIARTSLSNMVQTNPELFPLCIDHCYSVNVAIASGYFSVVADLFMRQEVSCDIPVLLSLILFKAIDPNKEVRDNAFQMLEMVASRFWAAIAERHTRFTTAVVGNVPESYQRFQHVLSAQLAQEHPELSLHLVEELLHRQLDALDNAAQHRILACIVPWLNNVNFSELLDSGWSERLLKSLYDVTSKQSDHFGTEIELLWTTLGRRVKNVVPILDYLGFKCTNDCGSYAANDFHSMQHLLMVAKRITLYVARTSPQQAIDHLVFELSERVNEGDRGGQVDKPEHSAVLEFGATLPPASKPADSWPGFYARSSSFTKDFMSPGVRELEAPWAGNGVHSQETPYEQAHGRSVSRQQTSTRPRRPSLSRADIALILLAEVAYEHDEDFRGHLPFLFHLAVVVMDSPEAIISQHCQHLLLNLLHSLVAQHVAVLSGADFASENERVTTLIRDIAASKGKSLWAYEEVSLTDVNLESIKALSSLVEAVVAAIPFEVDLRERWGEEALRWAVECSSRHLACRSHQVYRALKPTLTSERCMALLRSLQQCFLNPIPSVLGFAMEVLLSLQVMVEVMGREKTVLYPQLFWGCVALLNTRMVHLYQQALILLTAVVDRLDFADSTVQNILLSAADDTNKDGNLNSPAIEKPNRGLQPLVLKGLTSSVTLEASVALLTRLTLQPCDAIFGSGETCLLFNMLGLLPWLCVHNHPSQSTVLHSPAPSTPVRQATSEPAPAVADARSQTVAAAQHIAQACRSRNLPDLANAFAQYAAGQVPSIEAWLEQVCPPLCSEYFPQQAPAAFGLLHNMLQHGPYEHRRVVLLLMHSLFLFVAWQAPQSLFELVATLVEGQFCQEAQMVLKAAMESANTMQLASAKRESAESMQATDLADPLPMDTKEHSRTLTALNRVIDSYSSGRKREYRRLTPFIFPSETPISPPTPARPPHPQLERTRSNASEGGASFSSQLGSPSVR
eukprot:jgi/Chlat1/4063/Chrsp26S04002